MEKRPEYGSNNSFLCPFLEREDLLPKEKTSIGNYQDIHFWNNQKQDWSFEIPENWVNKSWCFMINSYCRDLEFRNKITVEERKEIEFNIQNIESAISKSITDKEYTLFKGLGNTDWLNGIETDRTYIEKAFGSYSLDINRALKYINTEDPILFQLILKEKSQALYIDDSEEEILLPRNINWKIKEMRKPVLPISSNINKTTDKEITVFEIEILKK
ncbi:ADP-ribosyltransferase [Methanimicrococcus blatticola]|uniref:ADP-ribosyltransferase n=1 Tax=Methanimicrococcus blatticola TaxID=91560 RepID=UPI00141511FB|nr:ADP-ribosyltransferase [Methanimicrococcus blatticola]MBZ3936413.1 hypothetical protein [Methanimicrococcus blatticola]MCC2509575.1 hypothetical protein [Methanimicrococcus blatticola]